MYSLRSLLSSSVVNAKHNGAKRIFQTCVKINTTPNYCQQTARQKSSFSQGLHFFFNRYLFLTNSVTSGLFMGLGDLITQELEFHSDVLVDNYDWRRVGRMFIVGAVLGLGHHFYYIYLDKLLPRTDVRTVFKKILCDQLCAAPITIVPFFYGMGLLEGHSFEECSNEVREKFLYVYMGDCLFWPPIQFINFYYLPSAFRVVYINAATMIFDIFLSFMKHEFAEKNEENEDSWKLTSYTLKMIRDR